MRWSRITTVLLGPLVVLSLCGVAIMPLLRGASPCTHDGGLHYFRVAAIKHALQRGLLFSRWLPNLAFGYGFPFFNYRAPLSYYLTTTLHLMGLSLPWALNLVYVLSFLGAALGAYLLARDLFGPYAGVVAGVAYAYAPYQFLDALVRGNAPEAVALALMPFVLWAFRRLALEGGRPWFVASVALLVALYVGHNISSLLFTPLLLTYLGALWFVYRDRGQWKQVALGFFLALGLTTFFWLPALAEKEYVQLYLTSATRSNDFHYNFLTLSEILAPPRAFDTSLMNPPLRIRLGVVQVALAALALILGPTRVWKQRRRGMASTPREKGRESYRVREQQVSLMFLAGFVVLFVLMSTPASVWLWEHIPLLPFVQFPWRFIGRASLPLALLVGAVLLPLGGDGLPDKGRSSRPRSRVHRLLSVVVVAVLILAAFPGTYPPKGYCPMEPYPMMQDVHQYERNTGLVGVDPVGAYFPVWVQKRPTESPLEDQYAGEGLVARFDASAIPDGGRILEADYGPNRARVVVESPEPFRARYLSFYFPGWRASVDGERVNVTPSDSLGLLTFEVPPGRHVVTVGFGETPLRLAADVFSLVCLLVACLSIWRWPECLEAAR